MKIRTFSTMASAGSGKVGGKGKRHVYLDEQSMNIILSPVWNGVAVNGPGRHMGRPRAAKGAKPNPESTLFSIS